MWDPGGRRTWWGVMEVAVMCDGGGRALEPLHPTVMSLGHPGPTRVFLCIPPTPPSVLSRSSVVLFFPLVVDDGFVCGRAAAISVTTMTGRCLGGYGSLTGEEWCWRQSGLWGKLWVALICAGTPVGAVMTQTHVSWENGPMLVLFVCLFFRVLVCSGSVSGNSCPHLSCLTVRVGFSSAESEAAPHQDRLPRAPTRIKEEIGRDLKRSLSLTSC